MKFPASLNDIIERIDTIDPKAYAQTRNYFSGAVSQLSPYISRGIISTRFVYSRLRERYAAQECVRFVSELLWREYFQRLQQHDPSIDTRPRLGNGIGKRAIPEGMLRAATGIDAVDTAISNLYRDGYMHNHARMYTASLCIMAGYNYLQPARWMYYHLLDGDVASNFCSWQWVAGLHTGKRYIANQENINTYSGTAQKGTSLDKSYADIEQLSYLPELEEQAQLDFATLLPDPGELSLQDAPVLIYNSYNLDPLWRKDSTANRILHLDPAHFAAYPVSEKVMDFIMAAARHIDGLQIFKGAYSTLKSSYPNHTFIAKEHPLFSYPGAITDPRDWLAEKVDGAYPSFSKYYSAVKKIYYADYI
ncbi:FAD-binding domain-containing protein [Flavobacterium sp. DGU11]|uniref:FAD-binding domain-containing protein n=1 Tax=Flavobacterium arundinis TaxID=3139143 RepID=A0ABU9HYZ5_9FLAO